MIIGIAGNAGSGKDTFASCLAQSFAAGGFNHSVIALADPIKHMAKHLFQFTDSQLWGPSEERSQLQKVDWLEAAERKGIGYKYDWLESIHPTGQRYDDTYHKNFTRWFETCYREYEANGNQLSARYVCQTLGTEFGRKINPNIWVDYALRLADKMLTTPCIYDAHEPIWCDAYDPRDAIIISDVRFRNEVLRIKRFGGEVFKITRNENPELIGGVSGHQSEAELRSIPNYFFNGVVKNDGSIEELADIAQSLMPQSIVFTPNNVDLEDFGR